MQRASLASSSVVNRKAASPCVCSAAVIRQAAAPLMSQAPKPIARSAVTRSACGSALQCGESGTVSMCTLNTRFGAPRTASRAIAPAPKSVSWKRKPGSAP